MKSIRIGLIVMMSLYLNACSNDDEEPVLPIFPVLETIDTVANSEYSFDFTVNSDWKLSSNAMWCTFPEIGEKAQTATGTAGSHSIKLRISDENMKFEQVSKAKLTLAMKGNSQVVAEIERAAKNYELTIFDADGNETNSLLVGTSGKLDFTVEANFEFAATKYPEWLEEIVMQPDAENSKKKKTTVTVREEFVKNSQAGAIIEFANEAGTAIYPLSIGYAGMDPTKIIIESKDVENGNFFNWEVSMDGKTFTKKNDLTNETIEIKNEMTFNITAVDDGYTPVFMEEYNNEYYFDAEEWMHLHKDGEIATFTVDASDRERKGFVLIFPDAVYNNIKNDLRGNIIETDGTIKYEYEQKYFLIAFTQKKEAEVGAFFIRNGLTWEEIASAKVTDSSILEYVMGNCMYYGEDIYSVNVVPGTSLIIYPQLSESVWTCDMGAMIMGDEHAIIDSIILDPLIDDTGHSIQFKVPDAATKPIYIVIKDNYWQFLKVLVVIPINN